MKDINTCNHSSRQKGFTIVELMIALSVLSTILVISAAVVINLGILYSKGLNQSVTQNTARNIINEVAIQLQQGGAVPIIPPPTVPPASNGSLCLGSQRYSYILNHKLDGKVESDHVLWRDTMSSSATCAPVANLATVSPTPTGVELMSANLRLTEFGIIDNANGTYTIRVTVAYGDDDLLVPAGTLPTRCIGDAGRQYCAVSSLEQTVAKRDTN